MSHTVTHTCVTVTLLILSDTSFVVTGEDVSENKDGSVLKSRIKNGQGINPPKDGAVCSGMYRIYCWRCVLTGTPIVLQGP